MKKFSLILRYASSSLVALVALIFTVLEATLLATLDFTLSENQFTAFIQLILRLVIAASALALGLLSMIKTKKRRNTNILSPYLSRWNRATK